MKSVLLADDNKIWLDILETGINREESFNVIGKTYNGKDTIEVIERMRPDVILLDIIMPEFDGVYIVNHIKQAMTNYKPIIYILSGIGTDTIIKIINELDVDFYSMKPVSLEIIIDTLKKITETQKKENDKPTTTTTSQAVYGQSKEKIKNILFLLGIPPHLFSTKCMIETIYAYTSDPEYSQLLTKVLYPEVAKTFGVSSSSIEKNLRGSIAHMQKTKTELYKNLFPYSQNKRISNGEFLSVVANYIESQH